MVLPSPLIIILSNIFRKQRQLIDFHKQIASLDFRVVVAIEMYNVIDQGHEHFVASIAMSRQPLLSDFGFQLTDVFVAPITDICHCT